jgi:hypothetical protein
MPARKQWFFDPDHGGKKIPELVKRDVTRRIELVAQKHFAGKYTRLDIRCRGAFCYIDAYQEPYAPEDWPPEDYPETREEFLERLRNTPRTSAGCVTSGTSDGALAFTPTAMNATSCPSTTTASSLASPKMRS